MSKLLARARWRGMQSDEEARAYLQARLATLSKLMFGSFAALLGFLMLLYQAYPLIEPKHDDWILVGGAVGLAILAFLWRVILVRRTLSVVGLDRIDTFFAGGTGMCFGAAAYIAQDFRPAAYVPALRIVHGAASCDRGAEQRPADARELDPDVRAR